MYSNKYYLESVEEFNQHNPVYTDMVGATCYLAYFRVGERGWFLYELNDWFARPHRVHTSLVKDVEYLDNGQVIVTTQNTKFTFTRKD